MRGQKPSGNNAEVLSLASFSPVPSFISFGFPIERYDFYYEFSQKKLLIMSGNMF